MGRIIMTDINGGVNTETSPTDLRNLIYRLRMRTFLRNLGLLYGGENGG